MQEQRGDKDVMYKSRLCKHNDKGIIFVNWIIVLTIYLQYQKFSKFYELQLLDLMDDLVLHDVTTYGDINFDIRKLISFINKYILGWSKFVRLL